jgi:MFS family permease
LSVVALAIVGFSNVLYLATTNTTIQTIVSDQFRGRVISIYTLIFLGGMPIGNLVAGTIATYLGASVTVMLSTALCLIYFAFTVYRVPELRTN